jgi:hypothetical protein
MVVLVSLAVAGCGGGGHSDPVELSKAFVKAIA